jgi:hypothetical protein
MAELDEHVKNVCKIGQGAECCKYLLLGSGGFECAKISEWKEVVDKAWNSTKTAQGDNCEGKIINKGIDPVPFKY